MVRYAAALLLVAVPAFAQVQSRPTDPPLVTAANESWYQLREPIDFAGVLYYPAGAVVFFDGNTMARVGHYNGVPLYMDTTLEPYSVLLVPVRRGLLQPYERRRQGDLVGTTASRTPSFPVRAASNVIGGLAQERFGPRAMAQAPVSPTEPQQPIGAISIFTPLEPAVAREVAADAGIPTLREIARQGPPIVSLRAPESNDGVWVMYGGQRWISAGAAVPLRAAEFRAVGAYAGFPVFVRPSEADTIYLPTRAGLVAPYRSRARND